MKEQRSKKRWTDAEVELLKEAWQVKDDAYFARVFKRSEDSIQAKRYQLGLYTRQRKEYAKRNQKPKTEQLKLTPNTPQDTPKGVEKKAREVNKPQKKKCEKCGFIKIGWFKIPVYLER